MLRALTLLVVVAVTVSLLDVRAEVGDFLRHAVEAKPVQEPRKVVGEPLALNDDRQERACPGVDEATLLEQPTIDVIEQQPRASSHVDESAPLWAEIGLAPEGGH